jgi:Mn-containing catalase
VLPIPNSHPLSREHREFSYSFISTQMDGEPTVSGRFTHGRSLDGEGEFEIRRAAPLGDVPQLAPPQPGGGAQEEQMSGNGMLGRLKGALSR